MNNIIGGVILMMVNIIDEFGFDGDFIEYEEKWKWEVDLLLFERFVYNYFFFYYEN